MTIFTNWSIRIDQNRLIPASSMLLQRHTVFSNNSAVPGLLFQVLGEQSLPWLMLCDHRLVQVSFLSASASNFRRPNLCIGELVPAVGFEEQCNLLYAGLSSIITPCQRPLYEYAPVFLRNSRSSVALWLIKCVPQFLHWKTVQVYRTLHMLLYSTLIWITHNWPLQSSGALIANDQLLHHDKAKLTKKKF